MRIQTYEGFQDEAIELRLRVPLRVHGPASAGCVAAVLFSVDNLAGYLVRPDHLVLFMLVEEGQSVAAVTTALEPVLQVLIEANEAGKGPSQSPTPSGSGACARAETAP
jgi:hypothetical protein